MRTTAATAASVRLEGDGVVVGVAAGELLEVRSLCHEGEELLVGPEALPGPARTPPTA